VETAQRAAIAKLEAQTDDIRKLREEMRLQLGLTAQEQEEIAQHLDADLARCEDELEFLRSQLVLTDLPYEMLTELVHVHIHGILPERSMDNGQYVLHQATQMGRRDVVEYLLGMPGARDSLHCEDAHGNTPLQYACQQPALEWRLREALRQGKHSSPGRWPGLESLDEKYEEVLLHIETTGWQTLGWKDGYTMLHWAAGKGYGQVCQYLVHLRADPTKLDARSRSPADVAMHAAQRLSDVAQILHTEESKRPRLRERAATQDSQIDMLKVKMQDLKVSREKARTMSFAALQRKKSNRFGTWGGELPGIAGDNSLNRFGTWGGDLSGTAGDNSLEQVEELEAENEQLRHQLQHATTQLSGTAGEASLVQFEELEAENEQLRYQLQHAQQASHRKRSAMMLMEFPGDQPPFPGNGAAADFGIDIEERWHGEEAYVQDAGVFLQVK